MTELENWDDVKCPIRATMLSGATSRKIRLTAAAMCRDFGSLPHWAKKTLGKLRDYADEEKSAVKLAAIRKTIESRRHNLAASDFMRNVAAAMLDAASWQVTSLFGSMQSQLAVALVKRKLLADGVEPSDENIWGLYHSMDAEIAAGHRQIVGDICKPGLKKFRFKPDVVGVAEDAYLGRTPTSILADALEDYHPEHHMAVAHLRYPTHFRGCWAIDWITGRR